MLVDNFVFKKLDVPDVAEDVIVVDAAPIVEDEAPVLSKPSVTKTGAKINNYTVEEIENAIPRQPPPQKPRQQHQPPQQAPSKLTQFYKQIADDQYGSAQSEREVATEDYNERDEIQNDLKSLSDHELKAAGLTADQVNDLRSGKLLQDAASMVESQYTLPPDNMPGMPQRGLSGTGIKRAKV